MVQVIRSGGKTVSIGNSVKNLNFGFEQEIMKTLVVFFEDFLGIIFIIVPLLLSDLFGLVRLLVQRECHF